MPHIGGDARGGPFEGRPRSGPRMRRGDHHAGEADYSPEGSGGDGGIIGPPGGEGRRPGGDGATPAPRGNDEEQRKRPATVSRARQDKAAQRTPRKFRRAAGARASRRMSASLLLVAAEADWVGAARFPKAARDAGWEVALLAPRDSLIEKGRGIARVGHLPDQANPAQWLYALAATVTAVEPKVVVPCDDMSFRLLAALTGDAAGRAAAGDTREAAPADRVLAGDAGALRRERRQAAAARAGTRTRGSRRREHRHRSARRCTGLHADARLAGGPEAQRQQRRPGRCDLRERGGAGSRIRAARAPAARHDPAVQPRRAGATLARRCPRLPPRASPGAAGSSPAGAPRCSSQIPHRRVLPACVASTTTRRCATRSSGWSPGWDMSGMVSVDVIVERSTGLPHVLEINRRAAPSIHRGMAVRVDLFAALLAAANGPPVADAQCAGRRARSTSTWRFRRSGCAIRKANG